MATTEFSDKTPCTAVMGAGADPADAAFDFQIIVKKIGDKNVRGVAFRTRLFPDIRSSQKPAKITIDGLLGSDNPNDSDPGWAETEADDFLWLEGEVDSFLNLTSTAIKSSKVDGTNTGGGEVEHDGGDPPAQTKFRMFFGQVIADDAGDLRADNWVRQARRLEIRAVDAGAASGGTAKTITAIFPFSF